GFVDTEADPCRAFGQRSQQPPLSGALGKVGVHQERAREREAAGRPGGEGLLVEPLAAARAGTARRWWNRLQRPLAQRLLRTAVAEHAGARLHRGAGTGAADDQRAAG